MRKLISRYSFSFYFKYCLLTFFRLFTHEATNHRFVLLQKYYYFCICYASLLRLDGFNMVWNMIFIVCRHMIHVSTLFHLSFFDCSPKSKVKDFRKTSLRKNISFRSLVVKQIINIDFRFWLMRQSIQFSVFIIYTNRKCRY